MAASPPEPNHATAGPTGRGDAELRPAALLAEGGSMIRSGQTVRTIEQWLDNREHERLDALLGEAWESDLAWLLEQTDGGHRQDLVARLRPRFSSEILTYLGRETLAEVVALLPPAELAVILADLDSDDVVDVVQRLDEERRDEALRLVSAQMRTLVEEGLTFPEDSAGRLMQREVVTMPPHWTVSQALAFLRATRDTLPERFDTIYLMDPKRRVTGVLPAVRLLLSRPEVRLASVQDEDLVTIPFDRDQEEVAFDFRRLDLTSAPVVDKGGRLLGVITIDDVLHVADREATEDLYALGGVSAETESLGGRAMDVTRQRFTWLAINLVTAVLASLVIAQFEGTLDRMVALAVLMPIVASMGGNLGIQTLTVAVRALATRTLSSANAPRAILREVIVGAVNGLAFAVLMAIVAVVWFGEWRLGAVIAAAMVVNLLTAALSGILVPMALDKVGLDPAVSSGVVLTTITDVVGFFVFLGLASLLIG